MIFKIHKDMLVCLNVFEDGFHKEYSVLDRH